MMTTARSLVACLLGLTGSSITSGTLKTILPALDGRSVASRPGTEVFLNPPERHGNASILSVDRKWEGAPGAADGGGITYATVLRGVGPLAEYYMWYSSMFSLSTPTKENSTAAQEAYNFTFCLALSDDGIVWRKPSLGITKFEGSKANNILFRGQDLYGASVVHDADAADVNGCFKLVYWAVLGYFVDGHGGHHEQGGMWTATSRDGVHWAHSAGPVLTGFDGDQGVEVPLAGTPQPQQCITRGCCTCFNLPQSVSDVQALTYDPVRRGWSVYHKQWIAGPDGMLGWRRAVGHSFTSDFSNWSNVHPRLILSPDEEDAPPLSRLKDQSESRVPSDLHGAAVHYHADAGLYIGRLMVLYTSTEDGGAQVLQQELIVSYNGEDFVRPFRTSRGHPFFLSRNQDKEAFDHTYIFASNGNLPTPAANDEDRWYYNGLNEIYRGHGMISGVGFFTQKRDRYAGIRASDSGGQVTLRAFDAAGLSQVILNLITAARNGSVEVELLTRHGWRLPGFTRENFETIGPARDEVAVVTRWNGTSFASAAAAASAASNSSEVALRIYLRDAELFGVTLK